MKEIPIGTRVLVIEPGRRFGVVGVVVTHQVDILCPGCGKQHCLQAVALAADGVEPFESQHLIPLEDPDADQVTQTTIELSTVG